MKSKTIHEIGFICKQFRESIGRYQFEVAQDTGYSSLNISSFETGRNNNMLILLWYLKHGLPVDELPDMKGDEPYEDERDSSNVLEGYK